MTEGAVFPTLRYRDVDAAISFLKEAFGFEELSVDRGDDGAVVHAELALGAGVVMVGPLRNDWTGARSPSDVGGVTGAIYVALSDVEAHYRRARNHGAKIARDLEQTSYGAWEYSAWDLEGHLWHFGDYRPVDRRSGE